MTQPAEISVKLSRVRAYLDRTRSAGALLGTRANFAWITAGGDNHVVLSSEAGAASVLVTREGIWCITDSIEAPRLRSEVLADTQIELIVYDWWNQHGLEQAVRQVVNPAEVRWDLSAFGAPFAPLGPDFQVLRWELTEPEIDRYRLLGRDTARALETTCRQLHPGLTEFESAAALESALRRSGAIPVVTLVAHDQRTMQFRHPLPTLQPLHRRAMLVTCAMRHGLICNATRIVSFGREGPEIVQGMKTVTTAETVAVLSSRPGAVLGDVFERIRGEYARSGQPMAWEHHHQGGITGYAPRERVATPGDSTTLPVHCAVAWNPSLPGCKSEDTFLVTADEPMLLTHDPDGGWPTEVVESALGALPRPAVLVL
jgi:Xaa-Pro aminopeptidase